MKLLIFLLTIKYIQSDVQISYEDWQAKHGVLFPNIIDRYIRKKNFMAKILEVEEHNANSQWSYTKVLNRFSHLTSKEFISSRCKTVLPKDLVKLVKEKVDPSFTLSGSTGFLEKNLNIYPFGNFTSENAPSFVNFRNFMEPVRDQGACGSCWAFATLEQIGAMSRIRDSTYNLVLGPQYLIDCDITNNACYGGWPGRALRWIISPTGGNNRNPSEAAYNYVGGEGNCNMNINKVSLGINKVVQKYLNGNEESLKVLVANNGPMIVAIYVTENFQSYNSGIFYDPSCPTIAQTCSDVNHSVIVTGYGTDPIYGDFWEVMNSWSSEWGESGYIRMARNKSNNCNIACWVNYAV